MEESLKVAKKRLLRNNEYYDMQDILDKLYADSKQGSKFKNLFDLMFCEKNILLAYRNIKRNRGSITAGVDGVTISKIENMSVDEYVKRIQNKMKWYQPKPVRRVMIPKADGRLRPLGIPCMEDRLIQQCIKQILEPICEAKFHNHSYGFRPNRSASHAVARSYFLMNKASLHYVVDIDIKGFFDNVNHGKLLKQLWRLGIQDKKVISIISRILKSEIDGVGVPFKGTPQGGIISPLLSNVVLNELDWWISSQWETYNSNYNFKYHANLYASIRNGSNLKEMWLVRYADDFKIFCRDYKTAQKIFIATRNWLKERLGLEISPEKSKITNLRKNYTEFLGFKMRVRKKHNKYVVRSHMSNKAKKHTMENLRNQIKRMSKLRKIQEVTNYNAIILGSHNYFKIATNVTLDFHFINYRIGKVLDCRLRKQLSKKPNYTNSYLKFYGKYKAKVRSMRGITLFPICGVSTKPPLSFTQTTCSYTKEGREIIHKRLSGAYHLVNHLLKTDCPNDSVELKDNKISLIIAQKGKCYVSEQKLELDEMECHHKTPKSMGGSDEYKNLAWVNKDIHRLIHSVKEETIRKYLNKYELTERGLKRLNTLRKLVGNSVI